MTGLLWLIAWSGVLLVGASIRAQRPPLWRTVAGLAGDLRARSVATTRWDTTLVALESSPLLHPWGTRQDLNQLLPATDSVQDVAAIRLRQLRSLLACLLAVTFWAALRQWTHPGVTVMWPILLLVAAFPFSGWLVRWRLSRAHQTQIRHLDAQLPAVLELLAFTIAAGEGMLAAVRRVADTARGPLPEMLGEVAVQVAAGASLLDQLGGLAERSGSSALTRACHVITVAMQRGTPLADVLRAQAADARAEHLRRMLELAGRREAAMMLPVVFLILPIIVVVAVYPGMVALRVW